MLTNKQRAFLLNFPEDRLLNQNERKFLSRVRRKTKRALSDLDLIFEKIPQPYLLFSEEEIPSLKKPMEEVTEILFYQNYRNEHLKRRNRRTKHQINKKIISKKTKKQIQEIVNPILRQLEAKP